MALATLPFLASTLRAVYADDSATPLDVVRESLRRIHAHGAAPVWITLVDEARLFARAQALAALSPKRREGLPLYGLPFAVKDNIDVANLPTTAACPEYAYVPHRSATVIERLEAAGAICIGKTNLDQFATGLVGVRSPYGAVPNAFDSRFISGGSSSGSAVSVARGEVAFGLGTDTAGSGRIPAAFNNLIGIKPSRGMLSIRGVVPACRSLDCVSLFAADLDTAWRTLSVAMGCDDEDPYSRAMVQHPPFAPRLSLGVPKSLEFFSDQRAAEHFSAVCEHWRELGADLVAVDFAPLHEAAAMLYQGPWVAERDAAVGEFVRRHPDACHAVVRDIVLGAGDYSAADAFRAQYRLQEIARHVASVLKSVDALLVPSAPTIYTIAEVEANPVELNARLGLYTNFVNLLDLAAIAVPAGRRTDGLPAGFTLIAPAGCDHALALAAHNFLRAHPHTLTIGDTLAAIGIEPEPLVDAGITTRLAVGGAHMRGMPLNRELVERGARFAGEAQTAARYRLYALPGALPKPGLVRSSDDPLAATIALELWDVPNARFGDFVAAVPPPLAIGNVELADSSWVKGFVCEPYALQGAQEITAHGGWRAYLQASRSSNSVSTS